MHTYLCDFRLSLSRTTRYREGGDHFPGPLPARPCVGGASAADMFTPLRIKNPPRIWAAYGPDDTTISAFRNKRG